MLRWIIQEVGVFALPFVAFAGYLVVSRRNPLERLHWDPQWVRLALAGIFFVVASLVMTGLTAPRHESGYQPPHFENGKLVPGGFP